MIRIYRPSDRENILREIPSGRIGIRRNQLQMAECDMYTCYVNKDKIGINGFALIRNLGDESSYYLEQITIKKNYRRKSIGTEIMNRVFLDLYNKHISLCVNEGNDVAIEFYESLDFQRSGYTENYRRGQNKYWYRIDLKDSRW